MTNTSNDITTAERAYENLEGLSHSDIEEFWVLALGPKKSLISSKMIFRGTVDSCLVHPRDIFRFACQANASSVLIAHNHPSGDLIPSYEDLRFTQQIVSASALMQIPVVDHLIVTRNGYTSLRVDGWCEFLSEGPPHATGLNEDESLYSPVPSSTLPGPRL